MIAYIKDIMPHRCGQRFTWLARLLWAVLLINTVVESSLAGDCKLCLEHSWATTVQASADRNRIVPFYWKEIVPKNSITDDHSSHISETSYQSHQRMLADVEQQYKAQDSSSGVPLQAQSDVYTCNICGNSYVSGIGDSLSSVASYCEVPFVDVVQQNPNLPSSGDLGPGLTVNIPCNNSAPSSSCTKCGAFHIIKPGDTLDVVSQSCELTLAEVELANSDIDFSNVFPGQYITIPCIGGKILNPITGCGQCGISFLVQQDGNISTVAEQCGLNVTQLLDANPAVNFSGIVLAGQQLHVPCSGDSPANCGPCGGTLITIFGDTIDSITAKCRVGYQQLKFFNPYVDFSNLTKGSQLKIPCDSIPASRFVVSAAPAFTPNSSLDIGSVAADCNVSVDLIAYANSLPFSGIVPQGQLLLIPCASLPSHSYRNCGDCGSSITLQSQVSLDLLAGACETTVSDIRNENGNFSFDLLGAKDQIFLPCNYPEYGCGACGIGYVTTTNDTLASVAVKCATMAVEIQAVNPGINFDIINEGHAVNIPCTGPKSNNLPNSGTLREPLRCLWCHDSLQHCLYSVLIALLVSVLVGL